MALSDAMNILFTLRRVRRFVPPRLFFENARTVAERRKICLIISRCIANGDR